MKLLLVFALFGVTCCLAEPTCSREELAKCSERPPGSSKMEELDYVCREIKCWIKMYDRCGSAVFPERSFPVKGYKKFVDAFCDISSQMRQKYLENKECIKRASKNDDRMLKMCDIVDRPREEYCRKIPDGIRCAVDFIIGKCGKDAGEVVQVSVLPYLDPYDCLSS